mmetsp:Transcript_9949/g.17050  ORF Transcript_9949/g.17050 Transcript_9949/m.17050 type:complete len:80 (-) Transcript_9949:241-480(-)
MVELDRETQHCLRMMKGGAVLGGAVGAAFGAIFGGMEAIRYREIPVSQRVGLAVRNTVGGSVVFAFFLAIGTGIRSCGR